MNAAMQQTGYDVASLVVSFPSGLACLWARFGALLERERETMRLGLAQRALQRKNYCVLRDLSKAELAKLGVDAGEIRKELHR